MMRKLKLEIPNDISVVAYDDIPEIEILEVPITTVGVSIQQLAERAISILCESIEGEGRGELANEELVPDLVVRQSTRPAGSGCDSNGMT